MKWVKYRLWSSEIIELPRKHLQQTLWGQRRRSWRKLRPWTWSQTWPASRTCSVLQLKTELKLLPTWIHPVLTANILGLVLNGLFEGGDVSEGAEEQDHHVSLVLDWRDVHQQPEWSPWQWAMLLHKGMYNYLEHIFWGGTFTPTSLGIDFLIKYYIPSILSHFTQ